MDKRTNIFFEFIGLIKEHRTYWIIPVVLVLLLIASFLVLGSTSVAPFIYTIF